MMPENIQDECYKPFREAYNDMSPRANYDGFGEQWKELTKDLEGRWASDIQTLEE